MSRYKVGIRVLNLKLEYGLRILLFGTLTKKTTSPMKVTEQEIGRMFIGVGSENL